jgi:hypothetical protein
MILLEDEGRLVFGGRFGTRMTWCEAVDLALDNLDVLPLLRRDAAGVEDGALGRRTFASTRSWTTGRIIRLQARCVTASRAGSNKRRRRNAMTGTNHGADPELPHPHLSEHEYLRFPSLIHRSRPCPKTS